MFARWWRLFRLLFGVPIAAKLWTLVAIMGLYSGAVVVIEFNGPFKVGVHPQMHTVLGVFLGMLLAFRNNTAYDRWWEGRKLWGQLVNDSRNLIIKVTALPKIEAGEAQHLARLIVNFARGLKEHLREGIKPRQLSIYKQVVAHEPKHVPLNLALIVRQRISQWRAAGKIDGFEEMQLDVHARALMDICGACERIRRTPLPVSYLAFVRQMIFLYLITLPWGLVDDFGGWTVPADMLVAYFMIGIELIAEDVGEPFGRELDDLRLDDICNTIEDSMKELKAAVTPETIEPGPAIPR
jgi:putative membrane protein